MACARAFGHGQSCGLPKLLLSGYWFLASPKEPHYTTLSGAQHTINQYVDKYGWLFRNTFELCDEKLCSSSESQDESFDNIRIDLFAKVLLVGPLTFPSWPPDTFGEVYFVGSGRKCLHNVTSFQTSNKLCFVLWCLQAKGKVRLGKEVWHRLWWGNSEQM